MLEPHTPSSQSSGGSRRPSLGAGRLQGTAPHCPRGESVSGACWVLRTQGWIERCSRPSGPSSCRAGFTIRVLHEGSESQRGDMSCPGPSFWPGVGQSLSLGQTCLTSGARNNLRSKYYAALAGAPGARPRRAIRAVSQGLGRPGVLDGGWLGAWRQSPSGRLTLQHAHSQPPQAKARLSAINIWSTNYVTGVSESEAPTISA